MEDARLVRLFERAQQLRDEVRRALGRQRPAPHRQLLEGFAGHELHHHEEVVVGAVNFAEGDDVRMIQRGERRRLGLKVLEQAAVARIDVQHLDRDRATEAFVDGSVDGAQGAVAEFLDESVLADGFSGHAARSLTKAGKETLCRR